MAEFLQLALFYLLIYFVINGIDDFGMDLRMAAAWLRGHHPRQPGRLPEMDRLRIVPARRIAILVPLWKESEVIEAMVESNLKRVDYLNYDWFLGVYPNDHDTLAAVERLCARHKRVHLALCGRPGPTSKANCLNFIYRAMERFESDHDIRFPVLMLHDAEDLLHPASLLLVNWYSTTHGMVQVPILPFAKPLGEWIHGVYCDEFAEFFRRDLSVRFAEGAFLPSNGVGTAISRDQLERLIERQNGLLFDEESLTEDYELGLKLYRQGCRQMLLPITGQYGDILATREYFPHTLHCAVRQRTRWITGQSLQSWERNGWPHRWSISYWFWRDRKGLLGNFLNGAALLLLALSLAGLLAPQATGLGPWLWIAGSVPGARFLYPLCTVFAVQRVAVRVTLVSTVYGWRFALGVPFRIVISCWLNLVATAHAIRGYLVSRWRRKRVGWAKTEHAFPVSQQLAANPHPAGLVLAAAAAASPVAKPSAIQVRAWMPSSPETRAQQPLLGQNSAATIPVAIPPATLVSNVEIQALPGLLNQSEVVVLIPGSISAEVLHQLLPPGRVRIVYVDAPEPGKSNPGA